MKKHLIIILAFSFFNYCCYSYYEISKDEIYKEGNNQITKIKMKDDNIIKIDESEIANNIIADSTIIIQKDTSKKYYKISEIDKIYTTKFNPVKTLYFSIGIVFVSIVALTFVIKGMYKM